MIHFWNTFYYNRTKINVENATVYNSGIKLLGIKVVTGITQTTDVNYYNYLKI